MATKHIPPASKTDFYAHIIKRGLDAWDEGVNLARLSRDDYTGHSDKFQHYIAITLIQRFEMTCEAQDPKPLRQQFFFHILLLGIESYQKEYDEFGIKRD